jgi:hypothetical protein
MKMAKIPDAEVPYGVSRTRKPQSVCRVVPTPKVMKYFQTHPA